MKSARDFPSFTSSLNRADTSDGGTDYENRDVVAELLSTNPFNEEMETSQLARRSTMESPNDGYDE